MSIKILIADDQRLFRQGLRSLLEQEEDLVVVGEAADGQDAFTLAQKTNPDIILMDVEMPKLDGIKATEMILERNRGVRILMLSVYNEDERVVAALRAGASGYILKDAEHTEFIRIIRSTHAGEKITSPFLANLAPPVRLHHKAHRRTMRTWKRRWTKKFSLTEREKEMLRLLLQGKSNKEISALTYVSTETVKSHLQNIYKKLDVRSRLEAVTLFLKEKR